MSKKRKKSFSYGFIVIFFFVLVSIIVLIPLYYLFLASFRDSRELFRQGMDLSIRLELMSIRNYWYILLGDGNIYLHWYRNSIVITLLFTIFSLFFSSMVGYALGVYQFKGRNFVFILVLFVMMIPLEILMLPLYMLMISLRSMNTYRGVIMPFIVSPLAIFFFRQYALGLAKDFMDAGRIDGATEYGLYFKIMAPLMKPAFGAMMILLSMQSWNSFLWPLIVLRTNPRFTLPIGLATLMTPYGNNYDRLIAGAVLAILPIVIVFLFNQRAFISGLSTGGIKG